MDRSYDKEIGLRELLLQELSDIVDDLIIQNEQNPKQVYTEENKYCILLTLCLERCITFGMKDSGFFAKRDFFEFIAKGSMHVKDEYLEQDFNSVQQLLLHKMGKARAWIRKTINEYHLARSLYSLASDREFIKSWFEPYAIMSTNAINDLYKEIEKLEQIHFQFNLKDRLLDHDDLFSLAPHQYRGANKLVRLRSDTDGDESAHEEGDESNEHKKRDKKSKRSKKDRKLSNKRNKSRRNVDLNEVNQSTNDEAPLTVETAQNSEYDKTKKSKKGKKKRRKKTKDDDIEQEQEEGGGDSLHLNVEHEEDANIARKQSLQEWQQNLDINTSGKHFSDVPSLATVSVVKSEPIRITSRRKGSISERIQNKLAAIPIKINSNMNINTADMQVDDAQNNNKVFRISSPSDYHTSFKWNDAATDNSSQIIERLYDDEHNKGKRQNFPDPMSYVEQIENEDEEINIMDDKELEQEITTLIENAPNDTNDDDGELSLSSEQDMNTLSSSSSAAAYAEDIDTIKEEEEHEASQSRSILSDIKREEILSKNDQYIAAKSKGIYAPEAQTFIHHIEQHTSSDTINRLGHHVIGDIAAQPLSIYFQSDNYFDDENASRDRRKQEQDKESKKRMQREQDVMRGNDSVYIQKSLNSSGMKSSGGSDNKPLDCLGNKVVLPSTGIILDETVDKSVDEFFVDQNGECFSCGDHLGSPQISRQCYYTQRLYCALCMDGTLTNMVPSKLIHNLDSRRYPISASSAKHLDSMYDVPAVPLSKIDLPSWFIPSSSANISILKNQQQNETDDDDDDEDDHINIDDEDSIAVNKNNNNHSDLIPNQNEKFYKLIKLGEYLEILSYIKQYFYDNKECDAINSTVQNALGRRHYLLDAYQTDKDSFGYFLKIIDQHKESESASAHHHHNKRSAQIRSSLSSSPSPSPSKYRLYGLISMRDIYELFNKDLLSTMQFNQQIITNHIKSCKECKKRSYGANVQFVTKFADVLQ